MNDVNFLPKQLDEKVIYFFTRCKPPTCTCAVVSSRYACIPQQGYDCNWTVLMSSFVIAFAVIHF